MLTEIAMFISDIKYNLYRWNNRLRNTVSIDTTHNFHEICERSYVGLMGAHRDSIPRWLDEFSMLCTGALAMDFNGSSSTVHMLLRAGRLSTFHYITIQSVSN